MYNRYICGLFKIVHTIYAHNFEIEQRILVSHVNKGRKRKLYNADRTLLKIYLLLFYAVTNNKHSFYRIISKNKITIVQVSHRFVFGQFCQVVANGGHFFVLPTEEEKNEIKLCSAVQIQRNSLERVPRGECRRQVRGADVRVTTQQ